MMVWMSHLVTVLNVVGLVMRATVGQRLRILNGTIQIHFMKQLQRFLELELAAIEHRWTAEGKGGYWWGVKVGLETALNKLVEDNDGEDY